MKRAIILSITLTLLVGLASSIAWSDCKKLDVALEKATFDLSELKIPELRAGCTLYKMWLEDSVLGYYSGFDAGMRTVVYFDPDDCHPDAAPMEITSIQLTLFDPPNSWDPRPRVWPLRADIVVYDLAVSYDSCYGPGEEICRQYVEFDSAYFCYPNIGTVTMALDCCVEGPFFIGLEYISTNSVYPLPSLMFDTTPEVDTCHIFQYYCDAWYGWYAFWPTPPGYPFMWINGETQSINCCPDYDSDGICEDVDNCPDIANADQSDVDGDGIGDVCDNCPDACDNCPDDYNSNQLDADNDGIGDVCDFCPNDSTNDVDGDGICGLTDNCPDVANADQIDSDMDGIGDACETLDYCVGIRGNINGYIDDGTDISDLVYLVNYMFNSGPPPPIFEEADVNADGSIDIADLVYLVDWMFNGGPAPQPCP